MALLTWKRHSQSLLGPSAAREARSFVAGKWERKSRHLHGHPGKSGVSEVTVSRKRVHTERVDDAELCFPQTADAAVLIGQPPSFRTSL